MIRPVSSVKREISEKEILVGNGKPHQDTHGVSLQNLHWNVNDAVVFSFLPDK